MSNYKSSIAFGVIGLGRFGFSLAETLAEKGQEVIALDSSEDKIKLIQDKVGQAFVVPHLDKNALVEAGIGNCGTVVVCIGEQVEASILTTLNVIELGVPRVIAKAISAEHGKVLQKIGAEVVFPEKDHAVRLANTLAAPRALDYINLSEQFAIWQIKLTGKLGGRSILDVDLRKKFGLNIIAIVRESETIVEITPDTKLYENDLVAVVGAKNNILKFERYLIS